MIKSNPKLFEWTYELDIKEVKTGSASFRLSISTEGVLKPMITYDSKWTKQETFPSMNLCVFYVSKK